MTMETISDGTKKHDAQKLNMHSVDPANVVIVGLDTDVQANEPGGLLHDQRSYYKVDPSMVDSVYRFGVLEPILVRKLDDEIEVVDGRQRVKAAREANKRRVADGLTAWRVPVFIKKGDDADLYAMSITANELRFDDGPIVKAGKVHRYIKELGKSAEDAAIAFGVDKQTVKSWLSLLRLPVKVQVAVESGKIGASSAAKLASLKGEEAQLKAYEELVAGKVSTTKAAHVVRKAKGTKKSVEDSTLPQPRRVLRKLIAAQDTGTIELDSMFVDAIRWVLGERSTRKINGLSACLRVLNLES